MTIRAVLFDFSGTLFRLEEEASWLSELTDHRGEHLDVEAQTELMRRMTAPAEQVVDLDDEHRYAWENRDLDPKLHQQVYLEVLKRSGVSNLEQARALYARLVAPDQWTPYPDTAAALEKTSGKRLRIGVLSNIAFNIRPAFISRGWDDYVNEFVLSFEVGAIKPDREIFQNALDRLEVTAAETLMIGDSEEADGGAKALGCAFTLVEPLPTVERTDGLLTALRCHGIL